MKYRIYLSLKNIIWSHTHIYKKKMHTVQMFVLLYEKPTRHY